MADAGVASRRDCEKLIESGAVEVNGAAVTRLPVFVDPARDRISVNGALLDRRAARAERIYLAINKPDNTLTTTKDDGPDPTNGRRTVMDVVEQAGYAGERAVRSRSEGKNASAAGGRARLIVVGRLGFHATGLVLVTSDGEMAQRLSHARYGVTKTYRITVRGKLHNEAMRSLRDKFCPPPGAEIPYLLDDAGRPVDPLRVVREGDAARSGAGGAGSTVIELVMRAGAGADRAPIRAQEVRANQRRTAQDAASESGEAVGPASGGGELARMLDRMGNPVKRLERIAIGPLRLRFLKPGEVRRLTKDEVEQLRVATGLVRSSR